jgi:pSer/pThr/pTyr-binding forkhead associated (FHA) protein
MPRLIMRRGPTPGAIYELEGDAVSIGRGSKNDIVIRDNEVSREHCQLRRVLTDYELLDLTSSNGTYINGQRVTSAWLLQSGAIVELGDTITMEYDLGQSQKTTGSLPKFEAVPSAKPEQILHHSLMVTMGPEMGHVYHLDSMIITIGRDLSNDIVIQDPEVSRFHMRLRRIKTGYTVEDMGSTNGTFVNGVGITQPSELSPDDVIRLARQVRLQYVMREEDAIGAGDETLVVGSGGEVRIYSDLRADRLNLTGQTAPLSSSSLLKATGALGATGPLRVPTMPEAPEGLRQTGRLRGAPTSPAISDSVFIAYARADWDRAVASMVTSLQQAGVQSWVDQYLVQHGDDWRTALEQALSECWAIVVVVSTPSLASNYVKMAYRYFAAQQKPLISFVIEPETTLPPDLTHARAILFDRENPQRSYHKLILEIMHLRR